MKASRVYSGRVNRLASFALLVGLISVFCGQTFAQEWRTIAEGVEHAQVRREFSGKPVDINLLRLDLRKVRINVKHALDRALGTETTSSIASRNNAIAAINAGFFRLDTSEFAGDPAGILMIDGQLLSEPEKDRVQLITSNGRDRTAVFFAKTTISLSARVGPEIIELTGINRARAESDVVLYTPEFGPTTMTDKNGVEMVVSKGRAAFVSVGLGNSAIPPEGFVISGSGRFRSTVLDAARTGAPVTFIRKWDGLPRELTRDRNTLDITNGVPQLISSGKIDITWEQEKATRSFVETRHPRTAVAKLRDGRLLMLTADGRTDRSAGLDLFDLADYLLELGAVDAMNLDGGGSTTMWLDGRVVNSPSDKDGERKVSDVLVVTLRGPGSRK